MSSLDIYPPYDAAKGEADMKLAAQYAQDGGAKKRRFTVDAAKTALKHSVAPGGNYKSDGPLAAAKKAAGKLFDKATKATRKIHFTLRETTRGSGKAEHSYVATKHKLEHPKTILRGDTRVHLHHKYDVKSDA